MTDSSIATIAACQACVLACERCTSACLDEDHIQTLAECIRLGQDCADACRLAVALLSRESDFARQVCALCVALCDACAIECSKHKPEHCRVCAEACRRCAELCRKIAA